jgi:hypothetical protein
MNIARKIAWLAAVSSLALLGIGASGCVADAGNDAEEQVGEGQEAFTEATCGMSAPVDDAADTTAWHDHMWCGSGYLVTSTDANYGSSLCTNAFIYKNSSSSTTSAAVTVSPLGITGLLASACPSTRVKARVFDALGGLVSESRFHGVYDSGTGTCSFQLDTGYSYPYLTGANQRVVAQATQDVLLTYPTPHFVTQYRKVSVYVTPVHCDPN